MSDYDPKKDIGAAIRLVDGVLTNLTTKTTHLDSQTNILIGISSALFVVSLGQLFRTGSAEEGIPTLFLALFSALSTIVGLFAIHPPKFMRKRGQSESLFYQKKISDFKNAKIFQKSFEPLVGDIPVIVSEYSKEIYNVSKYYYRPKRILFKISRNLLLLGVLVSLASLFLLR